MYIEQIDSMNHDELVQQIIEMGHIIRTLDVDNEHVEFWSNDED